MGQLTCVVCGGTNLLMDGGVFVCQDCGARYSVEQVRSLAAGSKATGARLDHERRLADAEEAIALERANVEAADAEEARLGESLEAVNAFYKREMQAVIDEGHRREQEISSSGGLLGNIFAGNRKQERVEAAQREIASRLADLCARRRQEREELESLLEAARRERARACEALEGAEELRRDLLALLAESAADSPS